ncbi:MAG: glycosyltransferase family 2 protein, partial [Alphaproteobacteria bacterium]
MSAARVPRASIIVPSFDHGPFVLGAVRSVLDQTEPDVEVLVIDDGSTDDSLARLATVDDPRVTVLRHPNRGLSRTLNRGLQFARARWVKFLPSDDMLAPACIERELAAIEDPDVGAVFCLPEVVDAYGHPLADPAPQAWFDTAARDDRSILPGLFERNFLCAPGALFDRELARELGGFDPDMKVAQDYDLWLRLLVRRRARLVPERLVRVRWHGANQSAVATPSTEAERARALVRAVAPGSRGDWIRRFAGEVAGRRGESLGRRSFAGALRRSGVPDVLPLATEMERCADELARGGPAARVARVVRSGLRGAVGLARRRLRPRWMRGVEGGRRSTGAASTAGARVATIEPGRFAPASPDVADASGRVPRWIVLDPSPVPVGASTRAARLADAL